MTDEVPLLAATDEARLLAATDKEQLLTTTDEVCVCDIKHDRTL